MSLSPEDATQGRQGDAAQTPVAHSQNGAQDAPRRHSRLPGICLAVFIFEIGLFLTIFPWMRNTWDLNYFGGAAALLQNIWQNPYFRGAITGVGLVNIYIACMEMARAIKRV